jgi:hypothetical protein
MEHRHPDYYTHLLARRLHDDPTLTVNERRELDLHLLICKQCNADYTAWTQQHRLTLTSKSLMKLANE